MRPSEQLKIRRFMENYRLQKNMAFEKDHDQLEELLMMLPYESHIKENILKELNTLRRFFLRKDE